MAAFRSRQRDAFMARWTKLLADDTIVRQTIPCDGQAAGNIVSRLQDGERDLGYWVGWQFWGHGHRDQGTIAIVGHSTKRCSTRMLPATILARAGS